MQPVVVPPSDGPRTDVALPYTKFYWLYTICSARTPFSVYVDGLLVGKSVGNVFDIHRALRGDNIVSAVLHGLNSSRVVPDTLSLNSICLTKVDSITITFDTPTDEAVSMVVGYVVQSLFNGRERTLFTRTIEREETNVGTVKV